jgi:hypothetical protein
VYCDDHGDLLCNQCADPSAAVAGYRVYRGSMVALLIGAVVTLWLILSGGQSLDGHVRITGLPGSTAALPSPTPPDAIREGGSRP